jgi:hypothetical protein
MEAMRSEYLDFAVLNHDEDLIDSYVRHGEQPSSVARLTMVGTTSDGWQDGCQIPAGLYTGDSGFPQRSMYSARR